MRLQGLITVNWGTLETRHWPLADATLLTGESGSGKSTLLDAIQAVLTAARQGVFHFNAGQNESTQGRRGGKEPRTLHAYALGQCGSEVFLRQRATSYLGLVFEASTAEEKAEPFSALLGIEAHVEGGRADGGKPLFFLLRGAALRLEHLLVAEPRVRPLGLKDAYAQLQVRLGLAAEQLQRFEGKDSYLQHLYGALLGRKFVPEADATRCARAIVKAMAYREIGNVNELVRDEILDAHDFGQEVGKMRLLMQEIARLKADAERLKLNIDRLQLVDEAAGDVVTLLRRHVVMLNAHALRLRRDALGERERTERRRLQLQDHASASQQRLDAIALERQTLADELALVQGELAQSGVAQEKQRLSTLAAQYAELFRKEWSRVQQAARQMDQVVAHVRQLLALDLSLLPGLHTAVQRLGSAAFLAGKLWGSAREALLSGARLDGELAAFELEPLDEALRALEAVLLGAEESSVMSALVAARSELLQQRNVLQDEQTALRAEQALLLQGRSPAPRDVQDALSLLERDLPTSRPRMLAALVEPKPASPWQAAIEGYMGRDRFALIVEPDFEEAAVRLLRREFARRSPKIVQGAKAVEDTRGMAVAPLSMLSELVCEHPIAKAYLLALYGRVKQVSSEAELRRTPQGLMRQGLGSRAYGMFACLAAEQELAFGLESRRRRQAWVGDRLDALVPELQRLKGMEQSLAMVQGWFSQSRAGSLAEALGEALATRLRHVDVALDLQRLDTSSIEALEQRQGALHERLGARQALWDAEQQAVGVQNKELGLLLKTLGELDARLPELALSIVNAQVWLSRFAAAAVTVASEVQLLDEARGIGEAELPSAASLQNNAVNAAENLPDRLKTLRNHIATYLAGARTDEERFSWNEPPRAVEQIEAVLRAVLAVQQAAREQVRRQDSIGLAENVARLEKAEATFNHVFTSDFCFRVRRDVKDGSNTLRKLSQELKAIQFGVDSYDVVQDWVPRYKEYYDFFEALDGVVDQLEKDRTAIFDAPQLSPEHRATAQEIKRLLLSQDQIAAERALKELADYRNYRRYDIHRIAGGHRTPMSTWGTGSGGELETPFYVIRAAVLAHALGHFGRAPNAPALRLMLSDEAFSKMDEARSRAVLRFLAQNMGLQLIVAMPTSKSGAIKPEFDKEYTFSKLEAEADGKFVHISEVQEKDFKREALAALWAEHAQAARAQARRAFEGEDERSA
ncbi:SbcC/MukB-like Walker B domain-containing protein [Paucibacter sp. R3-3]|uniref:SbcC/MukB-like Walker B domain-containing protein n=1 Tax=Roseateles agri TaxID=3098619 RepID=A0ABU5DT05_9BURK|nr:SbcC/MukB-like Walker B domain-containing protein [Paucibacter sp. R3-3]MDY0748966.1 SbcC/MukB-like Walker B domain-containing protein [Paucibacter sp. R3-3]